MRKQPPSVLGRHSESSNKTTTTAAVTSLLFFLTFSLSGALYAQDPDQVSDEGEVLEEVVVTGTQIKGASISEAMPISVFAETDIDAMGISSADELLDALPEQGQNFQSEAENISGGVNSVRGDIGAFNLRNMGTGNTLVLLNGRRLVQAAGFQTELVGGSFVPVNTVNPQAIPVLGIRRVEVLRDGASAIYGADAVAGVVNTILKSNFDGLTIRGRYDWYDNIPRNDYRVSVEWGKDFNQGRSNISMFADLYHRDRVSSLDDPKWADSDQRWLLDEDNPWFTTTSFRNDTIDSGFGQWDARDPRTGTSSRPPGITDSGGEFETFPMYDPICQHEDAWVINEYVCGLRDGVRRNPEDNRVGNWRYNLNGGLKDVNGGNGIGRDLISDLDRYNVFLFMHHEFDNGVEAYTEFSYYEAKTNLFRHPSATTTGVELVIGAQSYYNPFGPCGSPNRVEGLPEDEVPCEGVPLLMDFFRWVEVPRIVDTKNSTWRFLQGFRGELGSWDFDTALVWSEADRKDVTHNRISNTLMQEAMNDPTAAGYNPFHGGVLDSNIERALVDVYRENETDLKLVDFKLSKNDLFNLPAGPVGVLLGAEYREESFFDDRDPRLDGTIAFTDVDGDTFPYISDVANSSPSSDSHGSRNVKSLFAELTLPVFDNLDVHAAIRYEDLSDVGDTTVPRLMFTWRVFEPLMIRGSWSEAFRAPNLVTINEELVVRTNTVRNYACTYAVDKWEENNNGDQAAEDELICSGGVQRRASGSKDLEPEKSTNTSIGVVWEPTGNLMLTLDFWEIEKKDTIGLFGEVNHSMLDALLLIENGLSNCDSFVGNSAVGYLPLDPEDIPYYEAAGICPVGQMEYVEDKYQNLDTRLVKGHDIGLFYSRDTKVGSWDLSIRGTFYDTYEQRAGPATQALIAASDAGIFTQSFPKPRGFDDLIRQDGNQKRKYNASLTWRKDAWGARLSAYYLSSFIQTSLGERDGQKWVIPSMTTYNVSFDYRVDLWKTDTRFRLGINNFTNERAPLADRYFGYFADAHRDLGRYWYLDVQVGF